MGTQDDSVPMTPCPQVWTPDVPATVLANPRWGARSPRPRCLGHDLHLLNPWMHLTALRNLRTVPGKYENRSRLPVEETLRTLGGVTQVCCQGRKILIILMVDFFPHIVYMRIIF